jgi:uncharacterized protein with PQ loop repeat
MKALELILFIVALYTTIGYFTHIIKNVNTSSSKIFSFENITFSLSLACWVVWYIITKIN